MQYKLIYKQQVYKLTKLT